MLVFVLWGQFSCRRPLHPPLTTNIVTTFKNEHQFHYPKLEFWSEKKICSFFGLIRIKDNFLKSQLIPPPISREHKKWALFILHRFLILNSRYLRTQNPHGFISSRLSHMISYLPFRKPFLRVFFFLQELGCGKEKTL